MFAALNTYIYQSVICNELDTNKYKGLYEGLHKKLLSAQELWLLGKLIKKRKKEGKNLSAVKNLHHLRHMLVKSYVF